MIDAQGREGQDEAKVKFTPERLKRSDLVLLGTALLRNSHPLSPPREGRREMLSGPWSVGVQRL